MDLAKLEAFLFPPMKSLAFWLLLTLAVLVPATASLAATVLSPATVAKASCAEVTGGCVSVDAAATTVAHGHPASPTMRDAGGEENCCETGCGQCMVCAGCGVATVLPGAVKAGGGAAAPERHRFDTRTPSAEFLLSGQERPPRRA